MMDYHILMAAAASIRARTGVETHDAAVVLGSGLGSYASTLENSIEIPYSEIAGFPITKVAGHSGSLFSAPVGDRRVLLFAGRVHAYEG